MNTETEKYIFVVILRSGQVYNVSVPVVAAVALILQTVTFASVGPDSMFFFCNTTVTQSHRYN